jgi:hypothetical protein
VGLAVVAVGSSQRHVFCLAIGIQPETGIELKNIRAPIGDHHGAARLPRNPNVQGAANCSLLLSRVALVGTFAISGEEAWKTSGHSVIRGVYTDDVKEDFRTSKEASDGPELSLLPKGKRVGRRVVGGRRCCLLCPFSLVATAGAVEQPERNLQLPDGPGTDSGQPARDHVL